jgi:hypothetical protein
MHVARWACGLFSLLIVGTWAAPARTVESTMVTEFSAGLDRLVVIWKDVRNTHEYLRNLQPIAVVVGDSLVIFEPDSDGTGYEYRSTKGVPFPMSSGMRAAFPLQAT